MEVSRKDDKGQEGRMENYSFTGKSKSKITFLFIYTLKGGGELNKTFSLFPQCKY